MSKRDSHLDGWRGIAIISLLIGHFIPHAGTDAPWYFVNAGRVGVELFFALSGCLLGQILFVSRMPLRRYAIHRFARIVPSLWLYIAVAALLFAVTGKSWHAPTFAALSGWINYIPAWYHVVPNAEFGHLWSVCLELQGYVLIGLIAAIERKSSIPAEWLLFGLVGASWLASLLAVGQGFSYQQIYWRPEYRLVAMLLAAALVTIVHRQSRQLPAGAWPLPLLLGIACQAEIVPDVLKYTLGSTLIAIACAMLSKCTGNQHRWLNHPLLLALGTASYSIYLWQQPWHSNIATLHWLPALVAAISCGFLMHRLVDDRLHRAIGRLLERKLLRH